MTKKKHQAQKIKQKKWFLIPIDTAIVAALLTIVMGAALFQGQEMQKVLSWTKNGEKQKVTLLSTGDVMVGRSVNYKGASKNDFDWALRQMKSFLRQFDLTIVNLETPVIENCALTNEGMIFCADKKVAPALKEAGIEMATLANNHIYNQGKSGLQETKQWLQEAGILDVAEGEWREKNIRGEKFGVLAFDDVSQSIDETNFSQIIKEKSQTVDHLLVALHFGREYNYQPTERQKKLAHLAIDNGAEIILGNHSHWLGPIEKYQNGVIVYSHGNFVFDQMWSDETRTGMAIAWNFTEGKLTALEITPIWITEYGLANIASEQKATEILTTIQKISGNLGTIENEKLLINLQE